MTKLFIIALVMILIGIGFDVFLHLGWFALSIMIIGNILLWIDVFRDMRKRREIKR